MLDINVPNVITVGLISVIFVMLVKYGVKMAGYDASAL